MKDRSFRWEIFIVAPVAGALIVAALWLSISGALADMRFARFVSQVYTVVSTARDMKVDIRADAFQATDWLWDRLSQIGETSGGLKTSHTIKNPWAEDIKLGIIPVTQQLWVEATLPASVCYPTLSFVDKNKAVIGVRRILLREATSIVDWRQLYEGPDPQKGVIDPHAIQAWCLDRQRPMVLGLLLQLQ